MSTLDIAVITVMALALGTYAGIEYLLLRKF